MTAVYGATLWKRHSFRVSGGVSIFLLRSSVTHVLSLPRQYSVTTQNMAEENEPLRPVKLESEQLNSIHAVFETLDAGQSGQVAKSRLQVLCASLCRDCELTYSTEDLVNYKQDQKSLSYREFVDYLQEELLPKGKSLDVTKLYELCWTIVEQKFMNIPDYNHVLNEKEAYKQWLIFNILDIDSLSRVDKEEVGIVLEKFSQAMGKTWDPTPLHEFCPEQEMTFWQYLECLEKRYIGNDKSVCKEALEEVVDHVVYNVIKQGHLTKKGHKVRSMKERWFILKPGNLSYYTSRACTEKKGEILINKTTQVEIESDKGKYRFIITCGGDKKTTYEMEAKDQRTRQEWVTAIQIAIDTSEGPTAQQKERLERRLARNAKKLEKLEEERKKKEQENLLHSQQQELDLLREKYTQAEVQAAVENALLKEETKRREELEKLHQELEELLEAERRARETEEKARALQEQLLAEEKKRLEELEKLKAEKEQLLHDEKKAREGLEERQKEQERLLEEERKRLEELDTMRQAAEEAMREAQDKLTNAENAAKRAAEEAKERARELKTSVGLAQPIGPHNPTIVSHRGKGAFCEQDFVAETSNGEKSVPGDVVKASIPTRKGIEEIDAQLDSILRRFKDRAEGRTSATSEEKAADEQNTAESAEKRPEESAGPGDVKIETDEGKEAVKNEGNTAGDVEGSSDVSLEAGDDGEDGEQNGTDAERPDASTDPAAAGVENSSES